MNSLLKSSLVLVTAASSWLAAHRRSPVVKAWEPSVFSTQSLGLLHGRAFGTGSHTTLVLHGLGATSEYWPKGYDSLASGSRVVIPDLLGFGGSLDMERSAFTLGDHLDALDACLSVVAPDTKSISVIAHSMGSGLALAFALRHIELVKSVTCSGAPIYFDRSRAGDAIADSNLMARLLLLDPVWAQRACAVNCRNRRLAGVFAAIAEPSLPVAITRRASLHTWPAYRDSLEALVLDFDWETHISAVGDMPLRMVWGSEDAIGDIDFARSVAASAQIEVVPGQGHHLPITRPDLVQATS